jgi:hypothetical protein
VAAVVGTISSKKVTDFDQITRKGFGGPKSDKEIDLGKGLKMVEFPPKTIYFSPT